MEGKKAGSEIRKKGRVDSMLKEASNEFLKKKNIGSALKVLQGREDKDNKKRTDKKYVKEKKLISKY